MSFFRRYSVLLGLLAVVVVVVVLLSTPSVAFSPGVTFVDRDLYRSSGDETYVRTKMDFGSADHVSAFPRQVGDWSGYDYDAEAAKESLGADVVLLRGYERPGLYHPIFFLIMQARTESSFHPPPVCYAAQGYEIEEQGQEEVTVADTSWTEQESPGMSIPLRKMVLFKESSGDVFERRVVLYCYVKGNQLTSDTITMIRVEALAPVQGSYDGILSVEKDFIAQAVPYMFEPSGGGEWRPLAVRLARSGIGGYSAIVLLFLVPVAVTVYLTVKWRRGSGQKSGPKG